MSLHLGTVTHMMGLSWSGTSQPPQVLAFNPDPAQEKGWGTAGREGFQVKGTKHVHMHTH
jgi:hypothetical protein